MESSDSLQEKFNGPRFLIGVRIENVPSYLHEVDLVLDCPGLGELKCDIAYGGNFYAIIDPQPGCDSLDSLNVSDIKRFRNVSSQTYNEN